MPSFKFVDKNRCKTVQEKFDWYLKDMQPGLSQWALLVSQWFFWQLLTFDEAKQICSNLRNAFVGFFLSITRYLTFTLFPELATEKDETSLILERCVSFPFKKTKRISVNSTWTNLLSLKVYDFYFLRQLISTFIYLWLFANSKILLQDYKGARFTHVSFSQKLNEKYRWVIQKEAFGFCFVA